MKKLYEVRAEVILFAVAESDAEAKRLGSEWIEEEISTNGIYPDVRAVTNRRWPREDGWDDGSLVYGAVDTQLGPLLEALPDWKAS